ncbi:MAG: antitoxin [Actinomycetota bacterium]|jgi:hypothetical protein|nr:antitoxin [Actinomycetota bacterium]
MLTRRLQVLVDEARYERLVRQASTRGTSIAALVREAIDSRYPEIDPRTETASRSILSADAMPVPTDPGELKREIAERRVAG